MISLFVKTIPALFFVVDPIGLVPIFLAMTPGLPEDRQRSTARRACLTAAAVLIAFALFGTYLFKAFGISLAAFRVAGGVLLFLIALDLLRAKAPATKTSHAERQEGREMNDIAIVPLAMPLIAGPGAIITVMVPMVGHESWFESVGAVFIAVVLVMAITYIVLFNAVKVQRVLRQTGIAIIQRVIGLLIMALAVQLIFDGAKVLLAGSPPLS